MISSVIGATKQGVFLYLLLGGIEVDGFFTSPRLQLLNKLFY